MSTNDVSSPQVIHSSFTSAPASSGIVMRLLPGLTCLAFPVLVWSISGLSPFLLPLTLIPVVASIATIFSASPLKIYPRAIAVAHLGVTAPALYNLIGALLDFQNAYPFHGNSAWVVLWGALLAVVAFEKPHQSTNPAAPHSTLKFAHGVSATAITLFALFHITNHLAGLAGGDIHLAVMTRLRIVYRNPIVETTLGLAVLFQIVSGSVLLRRRLMTANRFEMLQGAGGVYLLIFLLAHLHAVLAARYIGHIDTNWAWVISSNLLTDAWSVRLVPYYFVGIIALGFHGGCGLRYVLIQHGLDSVARTAFFLFAGASILVSLAVMTGVVAGSLHAPHTAPYAVYSSIGAPSRAASGPRDLLFLPLASKGSKPFR